MSFEDRDFIVRQVKQLAAGIGKFLSVQGVKDFIRYESTDTVLTDSEIEMILLLTKVRERQEKEGMTKEELLVALELSEDTLVAIEAGMICLDERQLQKLNDFVK